MSLDPCSAVDIQKAVLFVSTGPKSLRHPNLVREAKEIWSINATTRDWSIPRSPMFIEAGNDAGGRRHASLIAWLTSALKLLATPLYSFPILGLSAEIQAP